MNMGKILLNEVLSHADKLKEEIKKRLKCEIVDFEIVEYESREIGVRIVVSCFHTNNNL